MANYVLFGTLLKTSRQNSNLKLKEMAARLSLDPGLLSKIENNERKATEAQLNAFIDFFPEQEKNFKISWLATKLFADTKKAPFALEALAQTIEMCKQYLSKVENHQNIFEACLALRKICMDHLDEISYKSKIIGELKNTFISSSYKLYSNLFSEKDIGLILEKDITTNHESLSAHIELLNYFKAVDFMLDSAVQKLALSVERLQILYNILNPKTYGSNSFQSNLEFILSPEIKHFLYRIGHEQSNEDSVKNASKLYVLVIENRPFGPYTLIMAWLSINYLFILNDLPLCVLETETFSFISNGENLKSNPALYLSFLEEHLATLQYLRLKRNLDHITFI